MTKNKNPYSMLGSLFFSCLLFSWSSLFFKALPAFLAYKIKNNNSCLCKAKDKSVAYKNQLFSVLLKSKILTPVSFVWCFFFFCYYCVKTRRDTCSYLLFIKGYQPFFLIKNFNKPIFLLSFLFFLRVGFCMLFVSLIFSGYSIFGIQSLILTSKRYLFFRLKFFCFFFYFKGYTREGSIESAFVVKQRKQRKDTETLGIF